MFATLFLLRLPDLGPKLFHKLIAEFGSPEQVLGSSAGRLRGYLSEESLSLVQQYQRQGKSHPIAQQTLRDLEWLTENEIALVTPDCEHYPKLLVETPHAPPLLYVQGRVENLNLPQLAIVGSRSPSASGRENAFDFARQLARTGFAITSGLALGIDGAAHAGALAAPGPTIGVLGTGIDRRYPARHRELSVRIVAEGGTLVSEFPLGTTAQRDHFPRRNRIISGMSLGVLVVEAAVKSGSLITARYALQQNREVFAIPGSIHNPLSRGCHALLRDGATLVEQVADLEEPLRGLIAFKWEQAESAPKPSSLPASLSPEEKLVLTNLGFESADAGLVMSRCGLSAGRVMAALVGLELKGLVEQTAGGYQLVGSFERA